MSTFSQELIGRSGYLNEGFADVYDRYRPSPPGEVLAVLTVVAGVERPGLVVDLGCGTGLATRAWAERADEVIGVEPNPRMLERARAATVQANVRYVEAFGAETGLPDGRADLVTSFQSFHWMEPQPVLAEAARILRDGGVFAACDYDVPPFVEPEVDAAFSALLKARREARERLGIPAGAASWPKDRHLEEIGERTLSVHARAGRPRVAGDGRRRGSRPGREHRRSPASSARATPPTRDRGSRARRPHVAAAALLPHPDRDQMSGSSSSFAG
jgi:SAM-dependent methyltransferase